MIFRHKKLVAMLALASQGLGGFAAKVGAAEASAETVVISGFSRKKAGSDSELSTETGVETGPASRTVPRAVKLGIPLVGGAALLSVLAAYVRIYLSLDEAYFRSLVIYDFLGKPHRSLAQWLIFLFKYFSKVGFKIVLCGPSGSGKTCLLNRFSGQPFLCDAAPSTTVQTIDFGNNEITTNIYAAPGIDNYISENDFILKDADLVILVLDYTQSEITHTFNLWVDLMLSNMPLSNPVMVVLNKKDLKPAGVTSDEIKAAIEAKIKDREWLLYEASAKTGESNLIAWSGRRPASAAPAAPAAPAQG